MEQVTDFVSKGAHAELAQQLEPWGFLGLEGTQFRELIGYIEGICALCIIQPASPHNRTRAFALFVLFNMLLAAFMMHVYHRDGRQRPALVLAGVAMFLLAGERRDRAKLKVRTD